MYISASIIGKVNVGEPVIINKDELLDEIMIKEIGGETVGVAMDFNVGGCLTKNYISSKLSGEKILGEVELISGNVCIISCDSPLLSVPNLKMNTEFNNYRICFG